MDHRPDILLWRAIKSYKEVIRQGTKERENVQNINYLHDEWKIKKNSRKSVRWSAVPVAPM